MQYKWSKLVFYFLGIKYPVNKCFKKEEENDRHQFEGTENNNDSNNNWTVLFKDLNVSVVSLKPKQKGFLII